MINQFKLAMISIPIIAVLITCHNRKEKTLQCLKALYKQEGLNSDYKMEVFLVDDASTDGTAVAVKDRYPLVNIIQGNGLILRYNTELQIAIRAVGKAGKFLILASVGNQAIGSACKGFSCGFVSVAF